MGINGVQRTGTVPKIKSCNHNDVQDISYHHVMGPSASNRSGHSSLHQSCEFGSSHMNNNLNLGSLMDWQPVLDVTAQTGQQPARIRKESNTLSSSAAGYDVTDVEINCGTAAGGSGNSVVLSTVATDNSSPSGAFCDVPLQIFNQAASDDEQGRWDQEAVAGGVNGSRRQQKSNNVCEQAQVASRLHQIRDYINQTSGVMEQLQAAGTPQHMEQWLRLHDMLDGLRDSETKLIAIQSTFDRLKLLDEEDIDGTQWEESEMESVPKSNDVTTRRNELKVKVEESQRKLMELREQQAALLALKQKAQEQLKEARAAQGALLAATEEDQDDGVSLQDCKRLQERLQCLHNFYELAQSVGCSIGSCDPSAGEVVRLQNKLEELQTKKMQINQLVSRFDSSSSLVSNSQPIATGNCESAGSNSNMNNSCCSNQVTYANSDGQTTEEKLAELSALKEQRAKMQNALMSMCKSAQQTSTNTDYTALLNSLQEPEVGVLNDEDDEELGHINSPSCNLKQDNRAQAISQNQQQIRQQQPHSSIPSTGTWNRGGGQSVTPTCFVQQQLQSKSLKLQEAKARLHHLQQLLGLVEEFREAGKPIPEKILLLLNSPNGPLSNEDNLDLGLPTARLQNQQPQSSVSSSTSSLMSLFQPQSNNAANGSSATKERPTAQMLNLSNRSDVGRGIQNFYQYPPASSSLAPQQHLAQEQQPVVVKQKNNAAKLCSKTNELEEWMRKDDDPVSCINTDVHSQPQPAAPCYQDILAASAVWRHSPDYSSDGGRSQEENEKDTFAGLKAPPPVMGSSGTAVMAPGVTDGGSNCSAGFASVGLAGNDVSRAHSKDVSLDAASNPNYLSCCDMSLDGAAGGGVTDEGGPGASCNIWRKHSTGSCCSLPVCCGGNNRGVHAPCYCAYHKQDAVTTIGENLSTEDYHQPLDNNTNWVLQHISQLQSQLQHMCLTITNKNNNRGVLMAPPSALGPPSLCQQQQSGSDNSSTGRAADTLNHYLNCKLPYQHLMCNSLNQCCQLIWHQQCELATLKEAFHNIQRQQEDYNLRNHHHQDDRLSSHFTGDGGTSIANQQYGSRSNLRQCSRSHSHSQQRNRLTAEIQAPSLPSIPQPPLTSLPPPHYFFPSYGNNLNHGFQPFRHPSPMGSYVSSPTSTLNNQVPPGNRANNYWDNFRSYSRQNLLSARSKCNEGRMGSSVNGDCNSSPNDRYRSSVGVRRNSGGAGEREIHPACGGTNTSSTISAVVGVAAPCAGATACLPSLQQQQQQQQVNSLVMNVNVASEEVTAHNTPNRKEKLNVYQSEGLLFPNCLLPAQSVSSSQPERVEAVDGMSATSNKHKSSACDGSSKGGGRKSCKSKGQTSQGSENRIATELLDRFSNICNSSTGVNLNNDESFIDGILVEPNTVTVTQQKSIARDDPVRNSNCKRRLLTNNTNTNVYNKCNSFSVSSHPETESNSRLPFESLEESMYSEVAALISVNEQRPDYLLQLFKDLKRIDSDHDRRAALLTIHNLASNSKSASSSLNVDQPLAAPGEIVTFDNRLGRSNKRVQQQPHSIPWRDTKDTVIDSSSSCVLPLPTNCRKLDREVQSILVNMLPFLKSHILETCTPSLLESVRNLVLHLVPSPQNIPQQLDALLEDSLFKFQGCRLQNVYDELISVVADVLISELTFLHLTTSVNGAVSNGGSHQNEGGFHPVKDQDKKDRTCAETTEEEEGAVGGIDRSHTRDGCHSKGRSNNRHHQCSSVNESTKQSDPVVSEAELAEADQSSRHSNVICSTSQSPLITATATGCESQLGAVALVTLDGSNKECRNGHVELNSDFILPVMTDNIAVEYEDNSKTLVEVNQKKCGSNTFLSAFSPPSSAANVINAWAVEQDREHLDHAAVNECDNRDNDDVSNGFQPSNS